MPVARPACSKALSGRHAQKAAPPPLAAAFRDIVDDPRSFHTIRPWFPPGQYQIDLQPRAPVDGTPMPTMRGGRTAADSRVVLSLACYRP